ncbi:sigma-70 family RNA polymerase sigma factor [Candidatus Poribacteria bacterium]
MRTEDGQIIYKCLNGDSAAFGLLVDKYKASIYALAYSKLHNFHDAEDITQEAFIKAYRKLNTLRWWDNFLAWLYAITANLCKDWIRSQSKRPDREFMADQKHDFLKPSAMDSHRRDLLRESLHDALESLPATYHQVLTLYYLGGMSTKEMARFLGTSPSNISHRLSKARARLKKEMITVMSTGYENQRLQAAFTFHIVEMVKRINIRPIPRSQVLPWSVSTITGIVFIILSSTLPQNMLNSFSIGAMAPVGGQAEITSHHSKMNTTLRLHTENNEILTYVNIPVTLETIPGEKDRSQTDNLVSISPVGQIPPLAESMAAEGKVQEQITISGKVTKDGAPVVGAEVFAKPWGPMPKYGWFRKSDRKGEFTITGGLIAGQKLLIEATEKELKLRGFANLEAQPGAEVEILMEKYETTSAYGLVVDRHGSYILSAEVSLVKIVKKDKNGMTMWSGPVGITDEYGRYTIPDLVAGDEYGISASAKGYRRAHTEIFIATRDISAKVQDIMLLPLGEFFLEGTIRYTDGSPVEGAQVWAGSAKIKAITDSNGHYRINNLPFLVETYMTIEHPGHGSSGFGFIPTNQTHDFVISKAERYLAGKVVDTEGKPISGASVMVDPPFDEVSGHVNMPYSTNSEGEFRLEHVIRERESIYVGFSGIVKIFENVKTNRDDAEFVLDISPEIIEKKHVEEKMAIMRGSLQKPLEDMRGKPAPELNVDQWIYGEPVKLAELKGKIVVLHFWSRGFRHNGIRGIESIRLLNVLQREFGKDGLVVIGIHESRKDADEQREIMSDEEIVCRVALDKKLPAAETGSITFDRYNNPVGAVVVDRAGNIYGKVQYGELEERIRELVSD